MGTLHFDNFPVVATEQAGDPGGVNYEVNTTIVVVNTGEVVAYLNTAANIGWNPVVGFPIYPHQPVEFPIGDTSEHLAFGCAPTVIDVGEGQPSQFGPIWVAGIR